MKPAFLAVPALLVLALAGCGGDDILDSVNQPPPPVAEATVQSVTPCLDQVVPGTGGRTLVELIVPDTITVDLDAPSVFPNGRRLEDPVIDFTLSMALLDMEVHSPQTFNGIPLNPPTNDRPFRDEFPFLALRQGNPPISGSDSATQFDFVDAPDEDYVRVDRTGMPAISPALVGVPVRDAYNDAGPGEDDAFVFADELTTQLTTLTQVVLDELDELNLTPCAALR
jgi:hypothetical protein